MGPIRDEELTLVTNNVKDFRRLYAKEEIHAGLIILIPNVTPEEQRILLAAALQEIGDSLLNEAIEVSTVDGEIEIRRYDLPKEDLGKT